MIREQKEWAENLRFLHYLKASTGDRIGEMMPPSLRMLILTDVNDVLSAPQDVMSPLLIRDSLREMMYAHTETFVHHMPRTLAELSPLPLYRSFKT